MLDISGVALRSARVCRQLEISKSDQLVLSWYLVHFYIWAAMTPLWLGRRFLLERGKLLRHLSVLFLLSFPIAALNLIILDYANLLVFSEHELSKLPLSSRAIFLILNVGAVNVLIYFGILATCQAVSFFRKYTEGEFRLAQARLQALKMQLHPHFLFNSLNTIQTYIHEDVERADSMITHLGDLLRSTLKDVGEQEVTLRRELETLNSYLQIELMRFDNRLTLDVNVAREVMDARVPNLILQPLVENAVRHGIAPHTLDGRIEIKAKLTGDRLWLQVRGNGPGISSIRVAEKGGIGLANTRARLEHLYGAKHRFELKNDSTGGFVVDIRIPYRKFNGDENEKKSSARNGEGVSTRKRKFYHE